MSLGVAAAVFLIAYDGGSYGSVARSTIAVLALWCLAIGIALGLWPRDRIPAAALATAVSMTAFAAWTGLSIIWSSSAERSYAEFARVLLLLAVFLVAVLASSRRFGARAWIRGLALGITAVTVLSLASRLFPHAFRGIPAATLSQLFPPAEDRLSYPVQYWNGLATLLAFGVPLLLYSAAKERHAFGRGLAVLPLPAVATAIYLASSRGAVLSAALGAAVFIALGTRRWTTLAALLVSAAASVAAIEFTVRQRAVIEGPLTPGADAQGHRVALVLALVCLAAALVHAGVSSLPVSAGAATRPLGFGVLAAAVVVAAVALVAAHPRERFEQFKSVPSGQATKTLQQHIVSGSGNGRWQLWSAAWDEFKAHPVRGGGAGSYEAWWAQHGSLNLFVRDAHSLYVETLGELGLVGLGLLLCMLLIPPAAGVVRSLGRQRRHRAATAALTAVLAEYLFEAGIDWMWETTVVTLVAVVCMGLVTGPATARLASSSAREWALPRWGRYALRVVATVAVLALVVVEGIPLVAQASIERSQAAVQRGDLAAAADAASTAERVQPWAASPRLQLALVEERRGNVPTALAAIRSAIDRDPRDWRLRLIAARIETRAGQYRRAAASLREATRLNPGSKAISDATRP